MWLYMVSFYLEASPETKKRRLSSIVISLIILLLYSVSSSLFALQLYNTLFEVVPGSENIEAGVATILRLQDRFGYLGALLEDCALRVADIVMVCSLMTRRLQLEH